MEDDFTAQAQRFVRSAVFCAVTLGLAFGEWCFCGVGCGCYIGIGVQDVAPKLFLWRFWWTGVCSERVEIIPNVWCGANFVEAHMI